jgi:alpha-L-rhamnosidase
LKQVLVFLFLLISFNSFAQYNFKGHWITNTEDTTAQSAPYFRKTFNTAKKIKQAIAYVSGVGYHVIYVNGKPVTDAVLEQGYTRYDRRLLYNTYDLTKLLQSGSSNVIAAELGNGWYNMQSHAVWEFQKAPWRKTPRMLIDVVINYTDGSQDVVVTDNTWKCTTGPSQFNSMYAGEIYDARREIPGWNTLKFNDASWSAALETSSPGGKLVAQQMPSVKIIREIHPARITNQGAGTILFDMGQNFAGVVRLKVKGAAGTKVTLQYREILKPDGHIDLRHNTEHMRSQPGDLPFQTDVYILKGGGEETFIPQFTYHGFQYVQVTGVDQCSLTGLFYSTDFKEAGHFNSSDTMLNRLYEAARQSYRSNYISIPTDCPQREKNGWTADAHISTEIGLWNYDAADGYCKWLADIRDAQLPNGGLPGIVPSNGWGYDWGANKDEGFGPAWGSVSTMITWYLYLYEGDTTVIRDNYETIRKYTDLLAQRAKNYIYSDGLGDWMSIVNTPVPFTSTAVFYNDAILTAKMAAILGKQEDVSTYTSLASHIRSSFNEQFFDGHSYKDSTATALSSALFNGLAPSEAVNSTVSQLRDLLIRKDHRADFGVLGTKYILRTLSAHGYVDDAVQMLTDTSYAGWGNWIARGATTLWEDWPGEYSHNHIFFGDYCAWYYSALAGIEPDEKAPGFKHFFVHPAYATKLSFIHADHDTRYGKIVVDWKRGGGKIKLSVTVPAGTTATVSLPGKSVEVGGGKHEYTF